MLCHAGLCLNLSDALGGGKDSINRLDFYGPTVSSEIMLPQALVSPPPGMLQSSRHVQP